jgi:hypothetical protein
LDVAGGVSRDLQSGSVLGLIGAAQKAGTAYNTLKGADLKSIAISEATALGLDVFKGSLEGAIRPLANIPVGGGVYFPTPATPVNAGQPAGGGV